MDRQTAIAKIAKMLSLIESSTFDGETSAAAEMIDRLCLKYGVTVEDATTVTAKTEDHIITKRMQDADFVLFCAVAHFYDAKGFVHRSGITGRMVTTFRCVGSDAQQIQVKLYYGFLHDTMLKQCDIALKGEQLLASLLGKSILKERFRKDFKTSFAIKVRDRLTEMQAERAPHEHKEVTDLAVAKLRLGSRDVRTSYSEAAQLGANAGDNASLNKQAAGSRQMLQLAAA